jgi:hypothetical protein
VTDQLFGEIRIWRERLTQIGDRCRQGLGQGDALPVPESLAPSERQGSAQPVNVLLEEYWDVHRALQR